MTPEANASKTLSRRLSRLGWMGAAMLFLSCLLGSLPTAVEAGTLPVGIGPVDTVVLPDKSASCVLNTGDSTLTVVDPVANQVTGSISLGVPPNTARDIDFDLATQKILVGCSNGTVLSADLPTGVVTTVVSNPSANYSVLCADNNGTGGAAGWAMDLNSGWLHQFLPGGTVVPASPISVGTAVEMDEMNVDPTNPLPSDSYLMVVGNTTKATLEAFDRSTMTPRGPSSCPG